MLENLETGSVLEIKLGPVVFRGHVMKRGRICCPIPGSNVVYLLKNFDKFKVLAYREHRRVVREQRGEKNYG